MENYIFALIGGLIIGIAVSMMLLFNGRVTGISGIIGGLIRPHPGDISWRMTFLSGLVAGGFLLDIFFPAALTSDLNSPQSQIAIAGFLVGFGTLLGNGCTSGHGVCGISRLSLRSVIATGVFILTGALVVIVIKKWGM